MPRLTIDFPDEANKVLEKLAKADQTTKREVVRRALALYDYLFEQKVKGTERKLSITDQQDQIIKDILF